MPKNETDTFLDQTQGDNKLLEMLNEPVSPEKEDGTEPSEPSVDDPETQPESVKDRRHKRLEAKLQAERESNIALNARLSQIMEAQKSRTDESAEYLKAVERIYGTNTPEALEATEILKTALRGVKDEARGEALEAFREERRQELQAEREAAQQLDSMIDELEDDYNVTISPTHQKAFFKLLEKLSPKDADGNIIEYADSHAVWEEYQQRQKTPDTPAKNLAARSMVQGGNSAPSKLQTDSNERWLKEQGII